MKSPIVYSIGKPHVALNRLRAFTLIELLTVMAIIAVLAGLVLKGAGYAQNKAARDRAAAEIAAISVALESYKVDNGEYPPSASASSRTATAVTGYSAGSTLLFQAISNRTTVEITNGKKLYFESKPDIRSTGTANIDGTTYFIDPFGNPYGYATPNTNNTNTYNPTFDLWSSSGQAGTAAASQIVDKWVKNW